MIYAGVYIKKSDWVGELAGTSSAEFPGAVIGLECSEPRTAGDIKGDVEVLSDKNKKGLFITWKMQIQAHLSIYSDLLSEQEIRYDVLR